MKRLQLDVHFVGLCSIFQMKLDFIYEALFTHKILPPFYFAENHRLQSQYDNHLITKLVVVSVIFGDCCSVIFVDYCLITLFNC